MLGMTTTFLAVLTLWVLRWVDVMISREHRARLVLACERSWQLTVEVPRLLHPMRCHARFHECRCGEVPNMADYVFELAWRRPERAAPPLDVLRALEERYEVKSFELTTDNGR